MSPTIYLLLADLVVLIHFLFVVYALLGGLFVLKWKKMLWPHLAALAWGAYVEFIGRYCPLTPLEIWLRQQAGADIYQGGFISHYLVPLIYPPGITVTTQWLLGAILIGVNILIYAIVIYHSRRKTKSQ